MLGARRASDERGDRRSWTRQVNRKKRPVVGVVAPNDRPLPDPSTRPGIAGTAYDAAWIAGLSLPDDPQIPRFPRALHWLVENQQQDGSWGGSIPYQHDRIICTLAALASLARMGRRAVDRASVTAGTRYLWRNGHLLTSEPVELVGFELLLPALVQRAQDAGILVPPHLDIYRQQRIEKLRLIPPQALYSPRATVVHSLEFLGEEVDLDGLRAARGANGSIGNSPAATAFYLERCDDPAAFAYLERCVESDGGQIAPVLAPCETFELLWSAYHLYLGGYPAADLLTADERDLLRQGLATGGVSLSPSFPIPDADDTAVALILLQDLGEPVDSSVLRDFALPGGHFASFPHERHPSVGVNLHVLHALLRVPGYPDREATIARLVDYVLEQQIDGLYWIDKWHISPYYATAHALVVLGELPPDLAARVAPALDRSREWIRQTQHGEGSWGFYGVPTAEETAYCLLALSATYSQPPDVRDRRQSLAALRYLSGHTPIVDTAPPLWIDKCLYRPTLVVQAAIDGACLAGSPRRPSTEIHQHARQTVARPNRGTKRITGDQK